MQNIITETHSYSMTFNETILAGNLGVRTLLDVSAAFGQTHLLEANNMIGYSFYLESLIAQVKITSLPSAEIPNISPEYTSAEKFLEIEKILTNYPTISLQIWIDYTGLGQWNLEASIPIQNRKNQYYPIPLLKPYLTMGDVKPLPKLAKIGLNLVDDGHGLLGPGDVVRIHCDARKEVSIVPKIAEQIGFTSSEEQIFPVNQPAIEIASYNQTRKSIFLRNSGNTKLFFHFGYNDASELNNPGKKLYLMPGEAWSWENSYFVLPHPLWVEAVSDNAEDVGKITVFEAF